MSPTPTEPPLNLWATRLEAVCTECPGIGLRRVRVIAEVDSTQDSAWLACGGPNAPEPGWLVIAGRQRSGRGRLGRAWADTADRGLAMTLVLPVGVVSSVGVGVAVCRAAQSLVRNASLGLRWPNDVVERASGRKLAGVLLESRDGVDLIGIGVNVAQGPDDFKSSLRTPATSLAMLGGSPDRLAAACAVLRGLEDVLAEGAAFVLREATRLDTLVGSRRVFRHGHREFVGEVVAIAPDASIDLVLDDGRKVSLPAATTSIVHD